MFVYSVHVMARRSTVSGTYMYGGVSSYGGGGRLGYIPGSLYINASLLDSSSTHHVSLFATAAPVGHRRGGGR